MLHTSLFTFSASKTPQQWGKAMKGYQWMVVVLMFAVGVWI